jgi:predicted N-formylglutamate amidohydrolase
MHWAYDPGVSDLTRELAVELEAVAVLSKVSRLYVDVNRPVGASTLCRAVADGQPVHLNAFLNEPAAIRRAERARRIAEYGEERGKERKRERESYEAAVL